MGAARNLQFAIQVMFLFSVLHRRCLVRASKVSIDDFISQKNIAVVGVSHNPHKFGNLAYRHLKEKGYHVFPVGRNLKEIEGDSVYAAMDALPEKVDGVVIVVPPKETERVVREAEAAGVRHIWMQQGAESPEAIQYCEEHGLKEVHGECILMFAPPVKSYHRFHRAVMRVCGRLPA